MFLLPEPRLVDLVLGERFQTHEGVATTPPTEPPRG
jgi:hypothetical protein